MVGHSNGAFMSHRMACEHSDVLAGIITFSGVMWDKKEMCNPTKPVHVLHVHGTNDGTISYNGGFIGMNPYPSAVQTVDDWMIFNGCTPGSLKSSGPAMDLIPDIEGNETDPFQASGCRADVSHWRMNGAVHTPILYPTIANQIIDYINSHPKV